MHSMRNFFSHEVSRYSHEVSRYLYLANLSINHHLTALWSKGITSCFFEQLHTPRRQPDQDQDQNLMLFLKDNSPIP